jgi:glycogen phosphorylase
MTPEKSSSRGSQVAEFQESVRRHARYSLGKEWASLSGHDLFLALALTVRDMLVDRMLDTEERYRRADAKRLYYLSIEFLIGRSLGNNLHNLGIYDMCRKACEQMGVDLEEIGEGESDAALGNGGLGRLAACYLDSLATLDMPGFGYGINYEFGIFKQEIENGYQRERPDNWLAHGKPWLIERPEERCIVPVYGRLAKDESLGLEGPIWMDWKLVVGTPSDMPIVGYGGRTVNALRLYSATSSYDFDMQIFNAGDYVRAVEQKIASEAISKVLYPSDSVPSGRELRLLQEYFFVGCAIYDIVRRFEKTQKPWDAFPEKVAIQLNDTHPALAVAELMRVLIDEKGVPWERAWPITQATLAYTNHTLLPEALEKWPVTLLDRVLPRHLQLIYEINDKFLRRVLEVWPGDLDRMKRMSLIEEGNEKLVRMANLAMVGCHSVNGVAKLHSQLVTTSLAPDFHALWPERFNNKTNGVTQRRWLLVANPGLASLVTETIGDDWITDLDGLRALEPHAGDAGFRAEFMAIKHANKERLAGVIRHLTGIRVDTASLFDIQAKRIHEYKRQLLNVMHIIHEYLSLVEDGVEPPVPRTYIIAGKAAPGYWAAKRIIKLIHSVGGVVNNDRKARGLIRVVFLPDYRVSLAEKIIPAADLSEQISTAGTEASGTGNMKFAMNGAPTIGTLDGANIEIRDEVGEENVFIFGLRAGEIAEMRRAGSYKPRDLYRANRHLARVMDSLNSDRFSPDEPGLFTHFFQAIVEQGDHYFHLADLPSYIEVQSAAGAAYRDAERWSRSAILNVARIGRFSSDRAVREYAREIWKITGVPPADDAARTRARLEPSR